MKALIIADIDDLHWAGGCGKADILLSCGDVYDQVILEAASAFSCSRIFAVKGNHDIPGRFPSPIADIHLRVESFNNLTFGGLAGSWKYKNRGHFLFKEEEAEHMLASLPPVDVLIAHNSPDGIHDKKDGIHNGFQALNNYLERVRPRMLIHGHQHKDAETTLGGAHK